jgi:hypothetical protein
LERGQVGFDGAERGVLRGQRGLLGFPLGLRRALGISQLGDHGGPVHARSQAGEAKALLLADELDVELTMT